MTSLLAELLVIGDGSPWESDGFIFEALFQNIVLRRVHMEHSIGFWIGNCTGGHDNEAFQILAQYLLLNSTVTPFLFWHHQQHGGFRKTEDSVLVPIGSALNKPLLVSEKHVRFTRKTYLRITLEPKKLKTDSSLVKTFAPNKCIEKFALDVMSGQQQ